MEKRNLESFTKKDSVSESLLKMGSVGIAAMSGIAAIGTLGALIQSYGYFENGAHMGGILYGGLSLVAGVGSLVAGFSSYYLFKMSKE